MGISLQWWESAATGPATIDRVSAARGDALISRDTLGIDLTSRRNDPLLLGEGWLLILQWERHIVMETIIHDRSVVCVCVCVVQTWQHV